MQSAVKYFFVFSLSTVVLLPATQFLFHFPEIKNVWLAGKTEEVSKPAFNYKDWLNESFQKNLGSYLETNAGYKSWLIRLTNEWQFRIFSEADNEVVVGKGNWLFSRPYIETFNGDDLADYPALLSRIHRARHMQKLFDSIGKKTLFIVAPGKASYQSDSIPDSYITPAKKTNNYNLLKTAFAREGIEHLDLYQYFLSQKSNSRYPLFSQYGVHWSIYGGYIAIDSIAHYLTQTTAWDLNSYISDGMEITTQPRYSDNDLLALMNLISELPSSSLAYPKIRVKDLSETKAPKILVIGDSYMWTFYHCGLMPLIAGGDTRYWYYGNTVYDDKIQPTGVEVKNLNMSDELFKFDIILFVFTETNQANFDFNMTENFITTLEAKEL
jgi:hypothetical protein